MWQNRHVRNKPMFLWPTDSHQNQGNFVEMRAPSGSDARRLDISMQEKTKAKQNSKWTHDLYSETTWGKWTPRHRKQRQKLMAEINITLRSFQHSRGNNQRGDSYKTGENAFWQRVPQRVSIQSILGTWETQQQEN